jgi:hypothetical protein
MPTYLAADLRASLERRVFPGAPNDLGWSQQAELTDVNREYFGVSVALSADGSIALVGAPDATVGGNVYQGTVYVFVRIGSTWTQQASLTAADSAANDDFGWSVALSADGTTALIGANYKTVGANSHQGVAYVFGRSGSYWTQLAELTAADGVAQDEFGSAVAMSTDGTTALIGAPYQNAGHGAVYVFNANGGNWTRQQTLTAADGAPSDDFGWSVALSADGTTALIGADFKTLGGHPTQGAAYVFTRGGTSWSQQAELNAADGAPSDFFGDSAALSADGSTALIGALGKSAPNSEQGAAYVFTRSGTSWTQQQELTAADGAALAVFGSWVTLSTDGRAALIGADGQSVGADVEQGAAYVFRLIGSSWSQQQELTAADGTGLGGFGRSVALSADQTTAFVGAVGKGAAYVFAAPAGPAETATPIDTAPPTDSPSSTPTSTSTATATPTATATTTASPTGTAAAPSIAANVSRVSPFQPVALTCTHFGGAETIAVFWDSIHTRPLTTTLTDGSGALSTTVTAPQAISGTHTIIAVGLTTHLYATTPMTVQPELLVRPSSGPAGTRMVTMGFGFGGGQPITVYRDMPATPLGTASSNALGTFYGASAVTGTVPLAASVGQHRVYGIGPDRSVVVSTTFVVTGPAGHRARPERRRH